MSFTSTTIPAQSRERTAAKIGQDDLKVILKMLHAGEVVTDDKVYSEASKSGKMDARTVCYYEAYAIREAVLAADDKLDKKALGIRTWEDSEVEGGYRFGLRLK